MYIRTGLKASELIKKLEDIIRFRGDFACYAGGTDYPEGITVVRYNEQGDGYIPSNCIEIR